ncbi:hypothetical protein XI09_05190 [Bradyrhizobium sp. CCBAU 11386]|uniref:phage tail sheath family protein n=1 Tax=Bradyrhizobium sp. CCBAU 11386 TaxID=1630837 RepID=UPI00230237DA|nr:phage tail sheath C-terminal domain-containing protein [Bradyrhizobium sp. CCBAU 11386]MDA9504167.1 hypothetical protein [Bradyrhizobium sp. CCBAU 11386]
MPITPTFPGIYILEAPASGHTVTPAPTNKTVFIGYTHPLKTPAENLDKPVEIFSFAEYARQFGGFVRSEAFADPANQFGDMAIAINQFFLNGGSDAFVVSLDSNALPRSGATVPIGGGIVFTALEITDGTWKMDVTVRPIADTLSPPRDELADVVITYRPSSGKGAIIETYRRVSTDPGSPNFVEHKINGVSQLVTVSVGSPPALWPAQQEKKLFPDLAMASGFFSAADFNRVLQQDTPLDKLPIFNLMVIPGVSDPLVLNEALAFCELKRAFFIMDPPKDRSADGFLPEFPNTIQDFVNGPDIPHSKNGALYFPYLNSPDPITGLAKNPDTGKPYEIPPAASVAGIYAATDVARGVWKAPAGFQAVTRNTLGVVERGRMTDPRQGVLNPLGVNCLRDFPNIGTAVFGARTLVTTTDEQWRYVPVRRMALFLEQTFYANLKWVIFEPNAEPLWSAIRGSLDAFMLGLFRQQAFKGESPSEAFKVLCDAHTTTAADIDNGIVNILVGFAPLKPAEFVVITLSQLAGQTQSS